MGRQRRQLYPTAFGPSGMVGVCWADARAEAA
jgi:hypothetical protein